MNTGIIESSKSRRRQMILAFFLVGMALLVPRLFSLETFVAVDEINWLHRSANFYNALMHGDFEGTMVSKAPGVITTWIESAAFRLVAPSYTVTQEIQKTSYFMFELVLLEAGIHPHEILVLARSLMVLFIGIVTLGSFYYSTRLFGILPSLIGFLLLAFDPFLTALTRTSHLDAPQAVLMLFSLLAISSYLFVSQRWFDLILSGVAGAMALLAKLPGLFIVPIIGLLVLVPVWQEYKINRKLSKARSRRLFWTIAIWSIIFILTFFLLWPAMWTSPMDTLAGFLGQVLRYSSTASQTVGFGEIVLPSGEPGYETLSVVQPRYDMAYFFRYPMFFLWRSTPIVLLGLVSFIFFSISKRLKSYGWKLKLAGIWILIIVYTLGVTLPWKSSAKYFAPVFMVSCLIAGLGWFLAGDFLAKRTGKKMIRTWLLVVVLAAQIVISSSHFPYYFSYYNQLLGGGQRASEEMIVGVGEGLDIAGRILNEVPQSDQLRVMSWYGVGPFSYYFDGQVIPVYQANEDLWTEDFIHSLQRMDFLVIYTNQKFRAGPERLFEMTSDTSPAYTIELNGIEYAWIYHVRDLPFENEIERLNETDKEH